MKGTALEWFIGRRYLASRRGSRFLSLITLIAIGGVSVGVMALITVTAVMTGLQRDLREKILGVNPHIWVITYGAAMRMEGWPEALARVRQVPGVQAAAPFVHTELGIRNRAGYSESAFLRGLWMGDTARAATSIADSLRRDASLGRPAGAGLAPLVLGSALATRAGIAPGDTVTLISLQGAVGLSGTGGATPKLRRFQVTGTFHTGMYEYDNKYMYTRLEAAQELVGLGEAVTGLEVRAEDAMAATATARAIQEHLGPPYRADDWKTMNSPLFSALELEKVVMGVILLLIVVVAAFNIVSTLVMVVSDKTREIGILKGMGLTPRRVMRIFVMQGLVIGVVGSALGTAGGMGLTWAIDRFELIKIPGDIYFVSSLPVAWDPADLFTIVLATLVISFAATVYPALQAARLAPVDAIRHD